MGQQLKECGLADAYQREFDRLPDNRDGFYWARWSEDCNWEVAQLIGENWHRIGTEMMYGTPLEIAHKVAR